MDEPPKIRRIRVTQSQGMKEIQSSYSSLPPGVERHAARFKPHAVDQTVAQLSSGESPAADANRSKASERR